MCIIMCLAFTSLGFGFGWVIHSVVQTGGNSETPRNEYGDGIPPRVDTGKQLGGGSKNDSGAALSVRERGIGRNSPSLPSGRSGYARDVGVDGQTGEVTHSRVTTATRP
jgi:hypothetical protein